MLTPYEELKKVDPNVVFQIAQDAAMLGMAYDDHATAALGAELAIVAFLPPILVDIVDRLERIEKALANHHNWAVSADEEWASEDKEDSGS